MGTSPWKKSSRSGGQNQCVEARTTEGRFQVRDSKLGPDSPVLTLEAADWAGFLAIAKR
ncbi:hypothetical protein Afil01_28580 [Actinorhabdospora filicis]|uniref:DUF397 domain-containing protein n=1 Tax=Actinorhabdospora filicis TaxID=1785913 RepID=A0A9W6W9Y9_9ACTN|nr:DUF397 domain-containing protein [Actinorhabdospora filicis]GLZ78051.1 hypothetical protein Afil01_28580 [Actinorhabdospora filicis]